MKVDIITKTWTEAIVKAKIFEDMKPIYKELEKIRERLIELERRQIK